MSAASSSLISIATSTSSPSSRCNTKALHFQTPIISISKTHFKTPKLSFNFNTHYLNFYPLLRSSLRSPDSSPSSEAIEVDENPEAESSITEEELEIDGDDDDYDDDEDEEEEESEPESPEAGRLYIGNLPYAITSSELSQIFGEAGDVVSVEIVYDRVTDRSRGFAFITMASVQEAKEAIRMFNGSQIGGRTVKVNFPEVPRGGEREVMGPKIRSSNREFIESPHKIYAGNLSWIITSEKLKDTFSDQPGFLSAKVIYEKNSGRSRGFGFITFGSPEAAESALNAMNGLEVEGRPLRLNLAAGKEDTSRLPRTGRGSEINVDGSEILSSINS
ncbi:hypothetical protein L1887_01183 [Cichorium endivia]|nr:hypothetical protein L1887_01183 [Cichorium endivia]